MRHVEYASGALLADFWLPEAMDWRRAAWFRTRLDRSPAVVRCARRCAGRTPSGQSVRMESMRHEMLPIVVRKATAGDVASMQAVDVAARQRFREIDDPHISRAADDQPYWTEGLTRAATEQRAWVAIDDLGEVIGFAVAWVIDGEGHLDELAVTPAHGRRGIGRALVDEVLAWTAARGLPSCHVDHLSRRALERPVLREARLRGRDGVDSCIASGAGPQRDMGGSPRCRHAPIARGR